MTTSASATSGTPPGKVEDDGPGKKALLILVAVAIVALLFGLLGGYPLWDKTKEVVSLQLANSKLKEDLQVVTKENEELKKRKPTEIVSGLTSEQCTALATDIVGKSCVGKTVVKPVTKWRERSYQHAYVPQVPRPGQALRDYAEQHGSVKALDRCIFRVKGEIKAETFVENGEINCPIWRDKQLALFNQKPSDLLWERKYPTAKPM